MKKILLICLASLFVVADPSGSNAQVNVPLPLAVSSTGTFTNTQANLYDTSSIGGINIATLFASSFGGGHQTDAISGGVSVPLGATNIGNDGVAGYCTTVANSSSRTVANCTGLFGLTGVQGNNAAGWGLNTVIFDDTGLTGHNMTGYENDMNLLGSPAFFKGFLLTGLNQGGTLPPSATGYEISLPYQLQTGFICDRGSCNVGLSLSDKLNSNPSVSQPIQFESHNSSGTAFFGSIYNDTNGNLVLLPSTGTNVIETANGGSYVVPATGNSGGSHNDSGFIQSKKNVAGCTTGSTAGSSCSSPVLVTWSVAFQDADYSATCTGYNPAGTPSAPFIVSGHKLAASIVFNYFAITSVASSYASVDCIAVHD